MPTHAYKLPFSKKPLSTAVLLYLMAFSHAQAAQAAQASPTSPTLEMEAIDLPVMTVIAEKGKSATKTDSKIKDIPQAISVISKEEIRSNAHNNIDQATNKTSGVTAQSYGDDPRSDWMLVRGFNPARYLDGMPLPNGTWTADSRIEPYGLEQIEVLKGPSSVLYGQIPPGGMLNMVSKKPSDDNIHEIEAQVGNHQHMQIAADFSGSFDPTRNTEYRITGLLRDSKNVVDYVKDKRILIAPSLKFNFNEKTNLTLLTRYQKAETALAGGFLPQEGTLYSNPNGQISQHLFTGEPNYDNYKKTMKSVGYELEHKLNDNSAFRQNLRYAETDVDHRSVGTLGFQADQRTLTRYVYPLTENSKALTLDNQFTTKITTGGITHQLLAGLDYRNGKNNYASGFGFGVAGLDAFNPVYGATVTTPAYNYHNIQKQSQWGLYAQDLMKFKRWSLTLGLRHDWADTTTTDVIANTSNTQKDKAFSTRAALGYAINDDLSTYIAHSTSFQPTIGNNFNNNAFKPTKGRQMELGLKYQPTRNTLLTAAIYNLTQTNVSTVDPDHIFYTVQQGKIRVKGLELEGKMRINRNFSVNASYTYTDAKVTQSNDSTLINTHIALAPKNQGSIGAAYQFTNGKLKGLGLNTTIRFMGEHYGAAGNKLQTPSYTLVDAGLSYDINKWGFQLNASNLFNKRYVSACNQTFWCYYGAPRDIKLTATYRW